METAGLAAILTNHHCLARTSTEKLGAEMCFSWQNLCQGFSNKARPGSQHHIWPGCTACLVKLGGNQLSLITLSCAALVTPQQSCLGTDPVLYHSYNFVRNITENIGFSLSAQDIYSIFISVNSALTWYETQPVIDQTRLKILCLKGRLRLKEMWRERSVMWRLLPGLDNNYLGYQEVLTQ